MAEQTTSKRQIIHFDTAALTDTAYQYLQRYCHNKPQLAERFWNYPLPTGYQFQLQAIVADYAADSQTAEGLLIAGRRFLAPALRQIDPGQLQQVHAFAIAAELPQLHLAADLQIVADLKGNALLNAAIDQLRLRLIPAAGCLSYPISPGCSGMSLESLRDLFAILQPEQIGMHLDAAALLMHPAKSCCGFLLSGSQPFPSTGDDCALCLGKPGGCAFCRVQQQA